jgi:prepilin-type N-terminal cleavage/methylation domain-containing protein
MKSMKSQQSGFTLVEIAIVLVIIGLLLGGILKGQELINSAKVKAIAQDFKTIPIAIYGYQDRFRAVPGDDGRADTNIPNAAASDNGNANGRIDGEWNSVTASDESAKFWRAVRLSNFASGPTDMTQPDYYPTNVEGGRIGITGATAAQMPITNMSGTYVICSNGILGKYARQLDTMIDDGNTTTGSLRTRPLVTSVGAAPVAATASTVPDFDTTGYTVCMTF